MTYKRNCSNDDMFESMIFICCYVVIRILVCVVCVVCVCVCCSSSSDKNNEWFSNLIFYFEFFHTPTVANKKIDSSLSL